MTTVPDTVLGDMTGLAIPAHADALAAGGPAFLNRAMAAYGSLPEANRVAAITRCEAFAGGNSGHKVLLDIAWERPDPALDTALFVKFSRDFADPFRDRRRHELDGEIRLAALSRHPAFPVETARAWFGDFHGESGTGLLVTSRVAFGEGGIEPLRPKCQDHQLADPVEYYRATLSALARLAAADLSGRLSPEIDRLFPRDPAAERADLPIAWDAAGLSAAVARTRDFARRCPGLLPDAIRAPTFLDRLELDALAFLAREEAVRSFLHDPRMVALAHWNTNLDNAWFRRDSSGALACGLLDWGMVRRMPLAVAIWGGLSAADPAMLLARLDDLLAHFCAELAAHGGPEIATAELGLHFDLALALTGLALMMDVAALVDARLPDAHRASGPHDPLVTADSVVHGFLHVFTNFLLLWERRRFGEALARI